MVSTDGGKGGTIRVTKSNILFNGNSSVRFDGNAASVGGTIYGDDGSTVVSDENASLKFVNNNAIWPFPSGEIGGGIYVKKFNIAFNGRSTIAFDYNTA